jgi:hypothetical protein
MNVSQATCKNFVIDLLNNERKNRAVNSVRFVFCYYKVVVNRPKFYQFIPGPWTIILAVSVSLFVWAMWWLFH